MSDKMHHSDRKTVITQLANTLVQVALALEYATKGERSYTESAIKDAYYGLDTALHVTRGRPSGDPEEFALSAYITTSVPHGYDTVLGWTAKNNPDRIDSMFNPVEDTKRDGFALTARARREGFTPPKVEAPEALQVYGVTEINAYPVEWLRQRCG
jgi:hypothetical protein